MLKTIRYKLFYILLLLILSTQSNAQIPPASPTESTPSVGVAAGGGCLLGATVGTFIFPGLGTAIGCGVASVGAAIWNIFNNPKA